MGNLTFSQIARTLRGRWKLCLTTFALFVCAGIALTLIMPKKYTATASVLVDFRGTDPVSGSILPGQLFPGYLATQLDLIRSHNVALKVVDALNLDKVPEVHQQFMDDTEGRGVLRDWIADRLLKYIKLEIARDSSLIHISYISGDARFSAAVANAFAQGYTKANLELRVDPAKENSVWFDDQLKTLKTNLEKAQTKLAAYQQDHGIVSSDERLDAENARLQSLMAQLVLSQTQTYEGVSKQRQIDASQSRGGTSAAPDVLANPVIQRLKNDISQVQAKLSTLSSTVGVNHPQYQSTQEQLDSLNQRLNDEMKTISAGVRNVTGVAQQRESSLRAELESQKTRLLNLKKQRSDLIVLQGEADSAQRAYDAALQRLTQTRLESKLSQTNVAIVNPAIEPTDPSRPIWLLNIALAIVLGGNAAIGLALMRELSDRRVRHSSDLIDIIQAPLLVELVPVMRPVRRLALPFRK